MYLHAVINRLAVSNLRHLSSACLSGLRCMNIASLPCRHFSICRNMKNPATSVIHLRRYKSKTNNGSKSCVIDGVGVSPLKIETGELARFADGCGIASIGNTAAMVTVVSDSKTSAKMNFLPLVVDYRIKGAASGRIPTNVVRRELGPSDDELLASRLIDRSLRPLFPSGFFDSTHLVANLLAVEAASLATDPRVLSLNAASAALAISDIPWNGPLGAVRVGLMGTDDKKVEIKAAQQPQDPPAAMGVPVLNPTGRQIASSSLDLILAATTDGRILMIEFGASDLPLESLVECISVGAEAAQRVAKSIASFAEQVGKPKRELRSTSIFTSPEESIREQTNRVANILYETAQPELVKIFSDAGHDKSSRDTAVQELREQVRSDIFDAAASEGDSAEESTRPDPNLFMIFSKLWESLVTYTFRRLIFDTNTRCDGRRLDQLRPISTKVDVYSPLHGSSMFQRGQSQVMTSLTFDSKESARKRSDALDALVGSSKDSDFFLHYEFPQFAIGQVESTKSRRREIGHGALAEKALRPIVPSGLPFTTRLSCQVLESNGSTSMASVCGGSLALMDGGVALPKPVSGIAVGIVTQFVDTEPAEQLWSNLCGNDAEADSIKQVPAHQGIQDYRLLTDLVGIEDYMGDMDFKIAGTRDGFTAAQLDLKIPGIPLSIVRQALEAAHRGNALILDIMDRSISSPRRETKPSWPVTDTLVIPPAKRAQFVGPGGLNLRRLQRDIGVVISPVDETSWSVFAPSSDAMSEARGVIEELLATVVGEMPELEFGSIYTAKVVAIKERGVEVQLAPGAPTVFVPIKQLVEASAPAGVRHTSALGLTVGSEISLKFFGRDPDSGQIRLSRRLLRAAKDTSAAKHLFKIREQRLAAARVSAATPWMSGTTASEKEE